MNYKILIPARAGSKGIPGKNLKIFGGKPLIQWTIEAGMYSRYNDVYVSADFYHECFYNVNYIERKPEDATDEAPLFGAIKQMTEEVEGDYKIILLQPTSPLRSYIDVNTAVSMYEEGYDTLFSASRFTGTVWSNKKGIINTLGKKRRQEISQWLENGAIYIFDPKLEVEKEMIIYGKIGIYEMDKIFSIDIDTMSDWRLAEYVYHSRDRV